MCFRHFPEPWIFLPSNFPPRIFTCFEIPPIMDLIGLLKSQFLCHLVFCYVFIASGLIVNAIQLCTLVIWPINKQLFRKINGRLCYCISSRKIHSLLACFCPMVGGSVSGSSTHIR